VQVRRRVAAYGLCRDDHGRVLVVRASARSARPVRLPWRRSRPTT